MGNLQQDDDINSLTLHITEHTGINSIIIIIYTCSTVQVKGNLPNKEV